MNNQIPRNNNQIITNDQISITKKNQILANNLIIGYWNLFVSCILVIGCCLLATFAFAEPIKIQDLIDQSKKYDGKIVEIEGEAIGHIMPRGDYAWVNINDGSNSFSVWMDRKSASQIKRLGKYAVVGDFLRINGIINERCIQHSGEMDIHARSVKVLKEGYLVHIPLDTVKTNVLLFLIGALVCLYFIKTLKKQP